MKRGHICFCCGTTPRSSTLSVQQDVEAESLNSCAEWQTHRSLPIFSSTGITHGFRYNKGKYFCIYCSFYVCWNLTLYRLYYLFIRTVSACCGSNRSSVRKNSNSRRETLFKTVITHFLFHRPTCEGRWCPWFESSSIGGPNRIGFLSYTVHLKTEIEIISERKEF